MLGLCPSGVADTVNGKIKKGKAGKKKLATLILMHRLATCQDRVPSSHQASSLKSISDMWRGSGSTLFQLQNRLIILLLCI